MKTVPYEREAEVRKKKWENIGDNIRISLLGITCLLALWGMIATDKLH